MTTSNGGIMVILSSPSGAGKTTLTKKIQQKYQNFKISVSHTTRKPRSNEVEGIDYFFVNTEEFEEKIKNKELNLIKMFLVPPNKKELGMRLIQRNQDNPNVIEKRLKSYDEDIFHWSDYDYVIINDSLENCFAQIEKIILKKN
jgi:guanylate kinase